MFPDAVCCCKLYEHASGQDTVASYSQIEFFGPLVVQDLGDYLLAPPGKIKSALSVSKNKKWLSLSKAHLSILLANCGMKMQMDFAAQVHRRRITRVDLQDPVAGTEPDLVASRPTVSRTRH